MVMPTRQLIDGDRCPGCEKRCTEEDEGEVYCQACLAKLRCKDPRLDGFFWSYDCQGKQDLDFPIVELSTRYWPRGGGFHVSYWIARDKVSWEGNEARPHIKPSAKTGLYVLDRELVGAEFEAETEQEVKTQVEKWVAEQVKELIELLDQHFHKGGITTPGDGGSG